MPFKKLPLGNETSYMQSTIDYDMGNHAWNRANRLAAEKDANVARGFSNLLQDIEERKESINFL